MSERLEDLREKIRRLDEDILRAAARRIALARQVGDEKLRASLSVVDYAQERAVLDRGRMVAQDAGLEPEVADTILASLIRASVSAQDRDRVRSASVGAGKTAVVVGGEGRMGRWFRRFLEDQGYTAGSLDLVASDEENAWARAALPTADLVLSAAPPTATAVLYDEWASAPPIGVVADIASIKTPLVASIRRLQQAGARVASMHPMFGPSVVLLRDCDVVICDTGDEVAAGEIEQLFRPTTARLLHLPLAEHDRLMADVLTLAHATVIAFSLALPDAPSRLRSTTLGALQALSTNLLNESPDVYFEIQAKNPSSSAAIERLATAVNRVAAVVSSEDQSGFRALMAEGRAHVTPRQD
jgi:chorismate mutase / prephenate dehydrogenase